MADKDEITIDKDFESEIEKDYQSYKEAEEKRDSKNDKSS